MSIKYGNSDELRYLKYNNLKQEARIVANYYRDIIHSYGMDCWYWKRSVDLPVEYEKVLKSNNILRQAYGYDDNPTFTLSANLITYTEVEDDIFILDKLGHSNNQKTNFYFDMTDFATAFMSKLGQFKEYPMEPVDVEGSLVDGKVSFTVPFKSDIISGNVVCDQFVNLDCGFADSDYSAEKDFGNAVPKPFYGSVIDIDQGAKDIEYPVELTLVCKTKDKSVPKFVLPVNEYIARSFVYNAGNGEVATAAYFKCKINEDGSYFGTVSGTVLYYDLNFPSKFVQMISPNVGDVIVLDTSFGEQVYEVNELQNQQMTESGINPLVFKYIWKILATRRIDSHEDSAPRTNGLIVNRDNLIKETVGTSKMSNLIDTEKGPIDAVYGGFTGSSVSDALKEEEPLETAPESVWDESSEYVDGCIVNLMTFGNGSSIITDGFNLFFKTDSDEITKISAFRQEDSGGQSTLPSNLRYMKADASNIYFQNKVGDILKIAGNRDMKNDAEFVSKMETESSKMNSDGENFYKFSNCKTLLFSTGKHLFTKLEEDSSYMALA